MSRPRSAAAAGADGEGPIELDVIDGNAYVWTVPGQYETAEEEGGAD